MSEQQDRLPTISDRSGGDQAQSVAHTDNVIRSEQPPNEPSHAAYDLRASSANSQTRRAMENDDGSQGAAERTVGDNAPTFNQLEHHSAATQEAAAADPEAFILDVMRIGRFADREEAAMWCRSVVYALWEHTDGGLTREAGGSVASRLDDSAIWGGDFIGRFRALVGALKRPRQAAFVADVARAAGCQDCDPWAEDAIYSFFAALKARTGDGAAGELGELRALWER